ncbi:hypothetical protein Pla108_33920 [Botrimarina colliarenosi]|uniref:Uncharacterized protein n=1 Tax=Botrimarina colliarenosi TaxID=2528001 RepID=A0A5C6A7H6_9BACT|nr:hypothetical protein [Botrimarina colliarenosi]TWT95248.1 hypothetical protein Pla108_33920 [Botrimarina colliarenosi]
MSQKWWLSGVLLVAVGLVGVLAERSRSQEAAENDAPRGELRGEFGGGFGGGGGEYGGGGFGGRGGGFAEGGGRGGYGGELGGRGGREEAKPAAAEPPANPRLWVNEDPEGTERLCQLLRNEVVSSLVFPDGTPLEEILTYLSDEHDVTIQIDHVAFDEMGMGPDEPVSINVSNVRLSQAMRLMLEPLELTCLVDNGLLLVTTEEAALAKLPIAIYDVRDLLLRGDYDGLIEPITATVASDTWAENGGGEAEIRPYPQRGSLVVAQSMAVHAELFALLASMRSIPVDPAAKPLPKTPHAPGGGGGCYGGEHEARNEPTPADSQESAREVRGGRVGGRAVRSDPVDDPFAGGSTQADEPFGNF